MALRDEEVPAERRLAVVDSLLSGRGQPETRLFVDRAVATLRERSIVRALAHIGERAAERRSRLVATVISASPLTPKQTARLQAVLDRAYGRPVQVNVGVDEKLVGGLRITVGSQVVDASVLARLDEARRRLAS